MNNNWVKVYSDVNQLRAHIVCDQLIMNDIHAVVIDKTDSSYHTFGEAEVMVEAENEHIAMQIIAEIVWD
jgi:hypothetical protein